MATSMFFSYEDGPVLPISENLLQTIKNSVEKWRQLDGVEREVGVKAHWCVLSVNVKWVRLRNNK